MKKSTDILSKIVAIIFNFHFLPYSFCYCTAAATALLWTNSGKIKMVHNLCTGVSVSWSLFRNFPFFSFAVHENPLVPTDFKMYCLSYLAFSCIYSFFIKWWNSMPFFCMKKQYFCLTFFLADWHQMCHKNTIEISLIYWNVVLWIFPDWLSTRIPLNLYLSWGLLWWSSNGIQVDRLCPCGSLIINV